MTDQSERDMRRLLQETARDFLAEHAPVTALRKLRNRRDPLGYDPELWRQMAGMGWASIILPENYGGLDFGFPGLGVVLQEAGRTLSASPLFSSAVVGASALLLGGSEEQRQSLLPVDLDRFRRPRSRAVPSHRCQCGRDHGRGFHPGVRRC